LLTIDRAAPEMRYGVLETIREYGHERLVERGDLPAAETAHVSWVAQLGASSAAAWATPEWVPAFERIGREHENVRVALSRSLRTDRVAALRLAESLWPWWLWDGQMAEGRQWLERALAGYPERDALRAKSLVGLGALLGRIGERAESLVRGAEGVEIYRELGDAAAEARAILFVGVHFWAGDNLEAAERTFGASLGAAKRAGRAAAGAAALKCLGIISG
jgi:hypothetical protein